MSNSVRLLSVVAGGLLGCYLYYRWILAESWHTDALHQVGVAGYWGILAIPVLIMSPLLVLCGSRVNRFPLWMNVIAAIVVALVVSSVGLYGDWLVCAFLTRGSCE